MSPIAIHIIVFALCSIPVLVCSLAASVCLHFTVRAEERENIAYFGDEYRTYMSRSRRFIPFIW